MNKLKKIPEFKSEDEEFEFWSTHDMTDYFDFDSPETEEIDLSELKFTTKTVSIRLSKSLIAKLKEIANKKGVPYQSLMKMFLSERVEQELQPKTPKLFRRSPSRRTAIGFNGRMPHGGVVRCRVIKPSSCIRSSGSGHKISQSKQAVSK